MFLLKRDERFSKLQLFSSKNQENINEYIQKIKHYKIQSCVSFTGKNRRSENFRKGHEFL